MLIGPSERVAVGSKKAICLSSLFAISHPPARARLRPAAIVFLRNLAARSLATSRRSVGRSSQDGKGVRQTDRRKAIRTTETTAYSKLV